MRSYHTDSFKYVVWAIFIYAIIFGLRYGVGFDTISYIEDYKEAQTGIFDDTEEVGYSMLKMLFVNIGAQSYVFLGFVAFIQVLLILLYFKDKKEYLPYIAVTFMFGCVWLTYANGIRQVLAFSLFVYSLIFVDNKKWYLHYSFLILAFFFHKSALLLFILYPLLLLKKDWFPSVKVQLILFLIAIILGRMTIINNLMDYVDQFGTLLHYDNYLEDRYAEKILNSDGVYGIGYYVNLLLPAFIICQSSKLKEYDTRAINIYNLYFVGVLISFAFFGSALIQRINYYFYGFNYIIGGMTLYVLYTVRKQNHYRILLGIFALVFVGTLYRMFDNNSAFYFIWQQDEFWKYATRYIQIRG